MPKPILKLTSKAVQDLSNIWNYTYDNWSEKQADKYYNDLLRKCKQLVGNPKLGKEYSRITSSLRGVNVHKHIIFYRVLNEKNIEIERILHQRMDLRNRLNEE